MLFIQACFELNRKKFVNFKDFYAGNRANKTLRGARETWVTCSCYQQFPNVFSVALEKMIILFLTRFGRVKKHKLFIIAVHWVKPVWPGGPLSLTSTLLIRGLQGDINRAGKSFIKLG